MKTGEESTGSAETSGSDIIIATQNKGIIRIDKNNELSVLKNGLEGQLISSLCITKNDDLLLGTFDGLFIYHFNDNLTELDLIGRLEDIPYTRVQSITYNAHTGHYWIGTEDQGLFLLQCPGEDIQSYSVSKTGSSFGLDYANVQDIFEEEDGNLWICTMGRGVYELQYSPSKNAFTRSLHFDKSSGLGANFIGSIFQDLEGNLWYGTTGEGLFVLKDQSFSFFNFENEKFNDNILSLAQVDSLYWLGGEDKIMVTSPGSDHFSFLNSRNGLPDDRFTAIYPGPDGLIWIGTAHNGLYTISKRGGMAKHVFLSKNSLENTINKITSNHDSVWVATNSGVIMFNTGTGERHQYTTSEGLPHNKIRDIFVDRKNNVWIATRSNGLYNLTTREELAIDANAELEFVAITQDSTGDLWAGTNGDGIFRFSKDSLYYYSTEDGLRSNFCYSIATDARGNIWSGHRLGMSEINTTTNNIRAYSIEDGISADCNYDAVITSTEDELVFGTSKGLIVYDPSKDTTRYHTASVEYHFT